MTIALHSLPIPFVCGGTQTQKQGKRSLYHRLRQINQATPIGSLPPEILYHIFELAYRSNTTTDSSPWSRHEGRRPVPSTMSQVSGYLREVALNSPLLWADIDISPPWSFNTICLALSRSQTCPLHLYLTIPSIAFGNLLTPTVINASANILCDIVAPHIPRCRKITIKGDFTQFEPLLIAMLRIIQRSPVPFLESLVVDATSIGQCRDYIHPSFFDQGAPLLTQLRLTSPMASCLPPLKQVTSLHLALGDRDPIELSQFSTIAASCPALQTLAIYDDAICGPWPTTTTVDFPVLRSLQVYGSFMSVSDLLRVVEAPFLEDLVIAPFAVDDLAEYQHYIFTASTPKFTNLKSITLSPVSSSGFTLLVEASQCFPWIEKLTIPNIHADSFHDIFTGVDADVVWPSLKALALRNVDVASMERLLTVMSFRENAGRPLSKLYLDQASVQRVRSMLHLLSQDVEVVEFDVWSVLHDDGLLHEASHFVGNDFGFSNSR